MCDASGMGGGYVRCAAGTFVRAKEVAEAVFHVEGSAALAAGAGVGAVSEDGGLWRLLAWQGLLGSLLAYLGEIDDIASVVSQAVLQMGQFHGSRYRGVYVLAGIQRR